MKYITIIITAILISSCSVNKEMQATGGSKADGTIKLSYEYGSLEQPVIDEAAAVKTAVKRCKAWGYKNAEAFGGTTKSCSNRAGLVGGCNQWLVTKEYQCLN